VKSLERGLGKIQGLPNELSDLPSVNTFMRHKENNAYNEICYLDKKIKLVVPDCRKIK
jgi:hypothetical protein